MDSAQQTRFEPNAVPHPGETVLEYLDFFGWSQRDLARRTGLAPKTISEICSGKTPITPQTALVFEKAFSGRRICGSTCSAILMRPRRDAGKSPSPSIGATGSGIFR